MNNNLPVFMFDTVYTPEKTVRLMLENTKDGVLYIQGFPYDEDDETECVYQCLMDWDKEDHDEFIKRMEMIFNNPDIMRRRWKGFYADEISWRILRYHTLKSIAPKVIVDHEAMFLTAALVLNRFANEVEVLE